MQARLWDVGQVTAGGPWLCYRARQAVGDGGRQGERAMDDESIDPGSETSISDELDSDLDLIAGKPKGDRDYIEQDN